MGLHEFHGLHELYDSPRLLMRGAGAKAIGKKMDGKKINKEVSSL
jgi:hypothetical protein